MVVQWHGFSVVQWLEGRDCDRHGLLAPFCYVLGKDTALSLLGGVGKHL